jgi:hypothetical protein
MYQLEEVFNVMMWRLVSDTVFVIESRDGHSFKKKLAFLGTLKCYEVYWRRCTY